MARRKAGTGLSADADEARQQILAAAERVIQRYGVPKTTMDDIGKEPGYPGPRSTAISVTATRCCAR